MKSYYKHLNLKFEQTVLQRCQSSGNFLISGFFSRMLLYKSIGKSEFSGNLQPFQDFLTTLTGISDASFHHVKSHLGLLPGINGNIRSNN